MSSPPAFAIALAALLALPALTGGASAVAAEVREPEALYLEGKEALEAGRFAEATAAFEEALATVDDEVTRWQLLLGVAVASELSGRPIVALEHYRRFIDRATGSPLARTAKWSERLDVARRSVASAEAEVLQTRGLLIIDGGSPFSTTVLTGAGEDEVITPPVRRYLAPGAYRVHATATGRAPFTEVVELHVGDRRRVLVELPPLAVDQGDLRVVESDGADEAWIPIGAGAALVATGGILTGLAYSDAQEVERLSGQPGTADVLRDHARLTERGKDRQTASWICYGAGAVAIGTGVLWMVLADDAAEPGEASIAPVGVQVGRDGATAVFGGTF